MYKRKILLIIYIIFIYYYLLLSLLSIFYLFFIFSLHSPNSTPPQGTCKLPNHRKIRFGPNPNTGYKSYYYMEGSGSIPCTTQFFGGDPQEQTNQKSCWYGPNSYTNDTWVKCANQVFFILFYFILFYFILFYFILFYFILFYFILFYYLSCWYGPNSYTNDTWVKCANQVFLLFILFYFILFYYLFYFIK